jgi:hypothetical protein
MIKLKFKNELEQEKSSSCCDGVKTVSGTEKIVLQTPCCPDAAKDKPAWITGSVMTPVGSVSRVSTDLSRADHWGHIKCRISSFRNDYAIKPGLYAVGNPDQNADVLVSANYKFSFDMLRKELAGLNAWILVLDTKGINVWCAAGKGTFGTAALINRITTTRLKDIVAHRRIIVPQLGAPGVSAFRVKAATGFNVIFGPVLAKDLPAYVAAGYKATREMRTVTFSLWDRLVLTPIELHHIWKQFFFYVLLTLVYFGLAPSGVIFRDAFSGGLPFVFMGFMAVITGAVMTPLCLPVIPFRSFAIKGWLAGMLMILLSATALSVPNQQNMPLLIFSYLFFPLVSSYLALQFTGATTFTGITGVKKELKIAAPIYIGGAAVSMIILIIYKLDEWRII